MARIAGVNLPVQKHVWVGLQSIFGIGRSRSKKVCAATGVKPASKIKEPALANLHRLVFAFNRREHGRLRMLIDFLNDLPQ